MKGMCKYSTLSSTETFLYAPGYVRIGCWTCYKETNHKLIERGQCKEHTEYVYEIVLKIECKNAIVQLVCARRDKV